MLKFERVDVTGRDENTLITFRFRDEVVKRVPASGTRGEYTTSSEVTKMVRVDLKGMPFQVAEKLEAIAQEIRAFTAEEEKV